jgi:hypothetical protein
MRAHAPLFLLPVLLLISACSSGGTAAPVAAGATPAAAPAAAPAQQQGNANLLVLENFDRANENAYEAIQRLRPQWLQARAGKTPTITIDGVNSGSINELKTIQSSRVAEARYLRPEQTMSRGPDFEGGAIEIKLRGE